MVITRDYLAHNRLPHRYLQDMASEPTIEQINRALDGIEEGEEVVITLKDGSEVSGRFARSSATDVRLEESSAPDAPDFDIVAEQVRGVAVIDRSSGPE